MMIVGEEEGRTGGGGEGGGSWCLLPLTKRNMATTSKQFILSLFFSSGFYQSVFPLSYTYFY